MQITLPYTYQVTGTPKRCIKARTKTVLSHIPFRANLSEIDLDQAPIAFRIPIGLPQTNGQRSVLEVRWFNSSLYVPAQIAISGPIVVVDAQRATFLAAHDRRLRDVPLPNHEFETIDISTYRNVLGTTEEIVIDRLVDWVNRHIVIGGILYEEVGEPRYVAVFFGDKFQSTTKGPKHEVPTTLVYVAYDYTAYTQDTQWKFFKANQLDAAIAEAVRFASSDGRYLGRRITPSSVIEILIPEAIRLQPDYTNSLSR
jgi:hypothetical protein